MATPSARYRPGAHPDPTGDAALVDQADLADPATSARADLPRLWAALRRHAPVHRHPAGRSAPPFWVLTRYSDVQAVLRDATVFSSARGNMLESLLADGDPAGGRLLALTDSPRHLALRGQLAASFTPRLLRGVARRVRERADALVAAAAETGTVEFARDVAEQIPVGTICDLLGVPPDDHAELLRLSKQTLGSDRADQTRRELWLARNAILALFADLVGRRRAGSGTGDDLLAALLDARVDGAPLTDEEIVLNCYGLLLAGGETSRLTVLGAVDAFAAHPGQWQDLRTGRIDLAVAVEELLRFLSPAMHVGRTATEDVVIGGRTVRRGEIVTAWIAAANRDGSVFTDPEVLDLTRTPNRHLAFGSGPHFCIGSFLARTEIAAVLDALRRAVGTIEIVAPPARLYSTFLGGYGALHVTLHPDGS